VHAQRVARHPPHLGLRGPEDSCSKAHWSPSPPRVAPTLVTRPHALHPPVRPRPLPAPARLPRPTPYRRLNGLGILASETWSRAPSPCRLFKRPPPPSSQGAHRHRAIKAATVLHWGPSPSSAPRPTPPSSELTTPSLLPHVSSSTYQHATGATPLTGAVNPVAAAAWCRRPPPPTTPLPQSSLQIGRG
jgi:hypothetical protein